MPANGRYFELEDFRRHELSETLPQQGSAPVLRKAYHELPQDMSAAMRLVEHARTLFFTEDLSSSLPLGTLGRLGIPYEQYKLALTEEKPTIKPYDEGAWAELPDAKGAPIAASLSLLDALHERWVILLRSMDEAAFARVFVHPESGREIRLDTNLGIYAWHGKHHLAHITELAKRSGW